MYSNFDFLSKYWADIAQIGKAAESYLYSDPNACIFKIGLLGERIITNIFTIEKLEIPDESTQSTRIKQLKRLRIIPQNIDDILFAIRKGRNDAVHLGVDTPEKARTLLRMAFNLSCWFMKVYGDWEYVQKEYVEPEDLSKEKDYEEIIRQQEEQLKALSEHIEEIETLASKSSQEQYFTTFRFPRQNQSPLHSLFLTQNLIIARHNSTKTPRHPSTRSKQEIPPSKTREPQLSITA